MWNWLHNSALVHSERNLLSEYWQVSSRLPVIILGSPRPKTNPSTDHFQYSGIDIRTGWGLGTRSNSWLQVKHLSGSLKSPQTTLCIIQCCSGWSRAHLAVSTEWVSFWRALLCKSTSHFTSSHSTSCYPAGITSTSSDHWSRMLCLHITLELASNLVSIELAWVLLGVSADLETS